MLDKCAAVVEGFSTGFEIGLRVGLKEGKSVGLGQVVTLYCEEGSDD